MKRFFIVGIIAVAVIGQSYANGVTKDITGYRKAAEQGYPVAKNALDDLGVSW